MALTQVLHVLLVNERREKIEGKTTENKKTLSIFSNNCLLKNTKVNRLRNDELGKVGKARLIYKNKVFLYAKQ